MISLFLIMTVALEVKQETSGYFVDRLRKLNIPRKHLNVSHQVLHDERTYHNGTDLFEIGKDSYPESDKRHFSPRRCCKGKTKSSKSSEPVPFYCMGLCAGYSLPKSFDWDKESGICIKYKKTIVQCFERYRKFIIKSRFDKSCYRKDRKHQNPFKTIKILKTKERNEKVAECQDHCQSNDRCFYFSINLKRSECSLHENGDYENAEDYYGAPKFCDASKQNNWRNKRRKDILDEDEDLKAFTKIIRGEVWYQSRPLDLY